MVDLTQSDKDHKNRLYQAIVAIVEDAHHHVRQSINRRMVQAYWQTGRLIVEHEQRGKARASYGKQQLKGLSQRLTHQFGKGFDPTNLRQMRRFYLAFPIRETVSLELSWSHYNALSRLDSLKARRWYQSVAIGLILCSQKSETVVKYSILTDSEQLFAAKYIPHLPSEEELKRELEQERRSIESRIEETRGRYDV